MASGTYIETFKIAADQLLDAIEHLLHEGNVRHIVIKQRGRVVAEFPVTAGVVGVVFAPILAAIGTLAALLTECSIEVARTAGDTAPGPHGPGLRVADESPRSC